MYRIGIWLIALALVFNGAMAAAEIDLAEAGAGVAQGHFVALDADDCVSHAASVAAAPHGVLHRGSMHDHLRCCARCSMVSLLPAVIPVPVAFASEDAVFYAAQHDLVGRTVASDPHIPKLVV